MMPIAWISPWVYKPTGRQIPMPISTLEKRVRDPKPAKAKGDLWRWTMVEFRGGYRCLAGVLRAHAVVLDVDDGSGLETILAALAGLFVIAHSTFSATPEHRRWRVIVLLDQPVDAEGYSRVWRWLAMRLEHAGVKPDYAASHAAMCWAVPCRPPSGYYVSTTSEGAFLDAADAFAVVPAPEPLPQPGESASSDTYDRRLERAAKYLAKMPGAIQGSHGSTTTMRAAIAMVRGFSLNPDDALRLLVEVHNPMCAPPWSERELRHKVRQAWQRARVPFGAIVDRGRAA